MEVYLRMNEVRFIDLFAGMGGLRLGFEQALESFELHGNSVFVSEIKNHAKEIYLRNFPREEIHGDITKIDAKDIPDFDYLLAGFPCQAFSYAGNRLGFADTRGTLFFDVARILKEKQPNGFLLENVEGLVEHDGGKTFEIMLSVLKDLGYYLNFSILDGQDFGLAQSRRRIYIVGSRHDVPNLDAFTKKSKVFSFIMESDKKADSCEFSKKLFNHYKIEQLYGKQIKDKRGGDNNIHSWDFALKGQVTKKQKELLNSLLKQRRSKKWAPLIGIDQWQLLV